ncbi:hypothetical protein BKA70DRAFT_1227665 [Coprinopsis sp. MPI-PUGE-AT-0042]|nr:hypothetical protein BKA70DRAFT_1227665 [Coprinopsis sp. MPI-PUGE-AT-0042]
MGNETNQIEEIIGSEYSQGIKKARVVSRAEVPAEADRNVWQNLLTRNIDASLGYTMYAKDVLYARMSTGGKDMGRRKGITFSEWIKVRFELRLTCKTAVRGWAKLPAELRHLILKALGIDHLDALHFAFAGLKSDRLIALCKQIGIYVMASRHLNERVDALFRRSGLPPLETKQMLGCTDSRVTGSTALVASVECDFTNQDIDIITPNSQSENVIKFLKQCKFTEAPANVDAEEEDAYTRNGAIEKVHTLFNAAGRKVNVCQSENESSVAPILLFHNTCVMNWISFDGVTCLYPALTNEHKGEWQVRQGKRYTNGDEGIINLIQDATTAQGVEAIEKYRERGFDLLEYCTQMEHHDPPACFSERPTWITLPNAKKLLVEAKNPYCTRCIRKVGDGMEASMAFQLGGKVQDVKESIQWRLCMVFQGEERDDMIRRGRSKRAATQVGWVDMNGRRQWVFTTI